MAKTDRWPVIHTERKALASDLTGISPDRWEQESLCTGWTIRDVVAHMTATAKITPASFFPKLVGSGFRLSRLQSKDIAREKGSSASDTLGAFASVLTSEKHPPGPPETMLGETIVHSEDVRRALGIPHDYPTEALVAVADFYKGSNLILGTKTRIAGLSLHATDTTWSHGTGPEVAGPMLSLVMAMTGRKRAIDDLSGEGAATLRSRA